MLVGVLQVFRALCTFFSFSPHPHKLESPSWPVLKVWFFLLAAQSCCGDAPVNFSLQLLWFSTQNFYLALFKYNFSLFIYILYLMSTFLILFFSSLYMLSFNSLSIFVIVDLTFWSKKSNILASLGTVSMDHFFSIQEPCFLISLRVS